MQVRKDRTHLYGATNLDFRSSSESLPTLPSVTPKLTKMTHIDLLSSPKKNFDAILKSKYLKKTSPSPDPLVETYSFYKEKGKPTHEIIKISNNREKQLEKTGRNPFTGESNTVYDERLFSQNYDYKKLIKEKETLNADTVQETQMTGIGNLHHETLEGKVNLEKIKEIRRIIRRKYGARGNFQKIFNQWDGESKGSVSVRNVYDMMQRFGININIDESRVLVASADHDRTNDLNLDEFLELIFTDNEALNVDLRMIPVLSDGESYDLHDKMRNQLEEVTMQRHHDQMNHILKNKLNQIARVCVDTDYRKNGQIDYKSLHHHLRQLGFSEKLLPDSDINFIFDKYKIDQETFNYPAFLRDLKDFDYKSNNLRFEKLQTFIQKPKEVKGLSDVQKRLKMYDLSEPDEFLVLDNQRINVAKLENQRNRAKRIFREIYRKYPTKTDFENDLNNFAKELHDETVENEKLFSKDNLKDFIRNFFENNQNGRITKKDIEGFLSNFTYNQHGETTISEIPTLIYDEEDKDYYKRLGYKKYGPMPSKKRRFGGDTTPFENTIVIEEGQVQKTEDDKSSVSDIMKVKHHHRSTENKKLESILQKIEDKFFSGTNTALKVFRSFDIDNDGFVTHENLVKKIKDINLLPEEEIPTFLHYMDPTQKGILNFNEFTTKFRPLALKTDDMGRQTVIPNVTPDKEQTQYLQTSLPLIRSAIFDSKENSTQSEKNPLVGATRWGSSPMPPNTFLNFQANTGDSPMFITPKARFQYGMSASLEYQKNEKEMKNSRYNAKLETIRQFAGNLRNRIEDESVRRTKKNLNQTKMKGLAQWSYEHRNHLKNDWN